VTEDWAAVATAITQRMTELGVSQQDLITRSRVSKTVVSEIQRNTTQLRRSVRTLEALAVVLDWHPHHLVAILEGRTPPRLGRPAARSVPSRSAACDVPRRLAAIESQLREITDRIDAIPARLDQISADLSAAMRHNGRHKT
jgi:transcriptional regulator with XRE-family HTH domain